MPNTTQQTNGQQALPPANPGVSYGKGDLAYAPALAYAVVAKLMGEELKLSNTLKQIQADETIASMSAAADQATQTRAGASADALGQCIAGGFSVAQGGTSIAVESGLTATQGIARSKQHKLEAKLADHESKIGASKSPTELKAHTDTKLKLKKEIQEHEDKHRAIEHKKNAYHAAVQSIGQLPQLLAKSSASINKSSIDAESSLDQANQQAYKQVADEMSSSNQAALSTVNQFTNENFAAATAIRG